MDWIDFLPQILQISRASPDLPAKEVLAIAEFLDPHECEFHNKRNFGFLANNAAFDAARGDQENDLGHDILYLQGQGEAVHPPPEVLQAYSDPDMLNKLLQAYVNDRLPKQVALPPLLGQGYGTFDRVTTPVILTAVTENPYQLPVSPATAIGSLKSAHHLEENIGNDAGALPLLEAYIGGKRYQTLSEKTAANSQVVSAEEAHGLLQAHDTAEDGALRPVFGEGVRQLVPVAATNNPIATARARYSAAQLHALHLALTHIASVSPDAGVPVALPVTHRPYVGSPLALLGIEGFFEAHDQWRGAMKGRIFLYLNRPTTGQQWRWPIVVGEASQRQDFFRKYKFRVTREQLLTNAGTAGSTPVGWEAADSEPSVRVQQDPFHHAMYVPSLPVKPVASLHWRLHEDATLATAAKAHLSESTTGFLPGDFWSIRAMAGNDGGHALSIRNFEVRVITDIAAAVKNGGDILAQVIDADRVRQQKLQNSAADEAVDRAFILEYASQLYPLRVIKSSDVSPDETTSVRLVSEEDAMIAASNGNPGVVSAKPLIITARANESEVQDMEARVPMRFACRIDEIQSVNDRAYSAEHVQALEVHWSEAKRENEAILMATSGAFYDGPSIRFPEETENDGDDDSDDDSYSSDADYEGAEDDRAYGDEDEIETGDAAEGSDEEIDLDSLDHMARMIAEIKIEEKKLKRDKAARDSVPQAVLFTPIIVARPLPQMSRGDDN